VQLRKIFWQATAEISCKYDYAMCLDIEYLHIGLFHPVCEMKLINVDDTTDSMSLVLQDQLNMDYAHLAGKLQLRLLYLLSWSVPTYIFWHFLHMSITADGQ